MGLEQDINWDAIQSIERDICYYFHELAPYGYIMGDVCWGSLYRLPYWQFLTLEFVPPERRAFIRDGCLVLILGMAFAKLDGSRDYVDAHVDECLKAIGELRAEDGRSRQLIATVTTALQQARSGRETTEALEARSRWVYREVVAEYFRRAADLLNNKSSAGTADATPESRPS